MKHAPKLFAVAAAALFLALSAASARADQPVQWTVVVDFDNPTSTSAVDTAFGPEMDTSLFTVGMKDPNLIGGFKLFAEEILSGGIGGVDLAVQGVASPPDESGNQDFSGTFAPVDDGNLFPQASAFGSVSGYRDLLTGRWVLTFDGDLTIQEQS